MGFAQSGVLYTAWVRARYDGTGVESYATGWVSVTG
jgi:hypothetical protein